MKAICFGAVLAMSISSMSGAQDAPLNVEEWRSASEIIELAKAKIEEGGWYQVEAVPGAACMTTALESSWRELDKTLVDWDYARMAVNQALDAPQLASLSNAEDPLSTPYWGRYYMYWNDAEGRSEEEVLGALAGC